MEIPGHDALMYYATPPNSYIGTTIFLSYIVAALYATIKLSYSLYSQYSAIFNSSSPSKDEKLNAAKAARARHIKIYAFLASISFATLSYHMLMFLIMHYLEWSGNESRSFSNVSVGKVKRWICAERGVDAGSDSGDVVLEYLYGAKGENAQIRHVDGKALHSFVDYIKI
ncbi:uncharacterized protein J4E92_007359 [Alternaria infectoria]|uniref:uncharacterized protein n=1 Tax=Alternaria infectoria TaxID=45303 RepID=UPI002220E532|nr:uncharacterized protein J4E92_007359 [Alternaria infectoria]KAI4924278.1 hypothetical protein J4E92_007359 [Alternaria infectoria]